MIDKIEISDIEGLRKLIEKGFDEINDQFDEIKKKQDKIDLKLRKHDIQIAYGNSARVPIRSRIVVGIGNDDIEILPDYQD